MKWRGWTQRQLALALGLRAPGLVSQILLDKKRPGLDTAHPLERVTAEPREDGAIWGAGPIRTEEWEPSIEAALLEVTRPRPRRRAA